MMGRGVGRLWRRHRGRGGGGHATFCIGGSGESGVGPPERKSRGRERSKVGRGLGSGFNCSPRREGGPRRL